MKVEVVGLFDFSFVWLDEAQVAYVVQIKTGFSTLNETADINLTLIGEEASLESILLTCDSDMKPFGSGQLDTFYIPAKKLGKVGMFFSMGNLY